MGTQKNRLDEIVLLSTQNMLRQKDKENKHNFFFAKDLLIWTNPSSSSFIMHGLLCDISKTRAITWVIFFGILSKVNQLITSSAYVIKAVALIVYNVSC